MPKELKYKDELLLFTVIFAVLTVVGLGMGLFVTDNGCFSATCLFSAFIFILITTYIYSKYKVASRYRGVMDALGDVYKVELRKKTLKCWSKRYGIFYLFYEPGSQNQTAFYRVWIRSKIRVELPPGLSTKVLWNPPSRWWHGGYRETIIDDFTHGVDLTGIRSLRKIYLETNRARTKMVADFTDLVMYSETADIISVLHVMRRIEGSIAG